MWFRQILDFRVKDLKFAIFVNCFIKFVQFWSKIEILWSRVNDLKFWFSLGLRISNFINLPNSKFHQKIKFYPKKILNITNLVGSRLLCLAAGLATSTAAFRYDTIASKNIYDFQNDQNSFHKQSILFSASRATALVEVGSPVTPGDAKTQKSTSDHLTNSRHVSRNHQNNHQPPTIAASKKLGFSISVDNAGSGEVLRIFLTKFWWWEPILWNFDEFCKFWSISTSKFWKGSCDVCYPILGQILKKFELRILMKYQSYDKPPWRNFDFWSKFEFWRKSKIWNP